MPPIHFWGNSLPNFFLVLARSAVLTATRHGTGSTQWCGGGGGMAEQQKDLWFKRENVGFEKPMGRKYNMAARPHGIPSLHLSARCDGPSIGNYYSKLENKDSYFCVPSMMSSFATLSTLKYQINVHERFPI